MKSSLFLIAFALCACVAAPAHAALWNMEAYLDGLQEAPIPVATPGTGYGTAVLNDATGVLTVSGTFQDLIGTSNNAHVHGFATVGVPAGVLFNLTFDFGLTAGTFSGDNTATPFTPAQVAQVLAGETYVNIHTTFRPGGEIRGQLFVVPEPSTVILSAVGLIGLLALRRKFRS